ncbi:hypothetical protein QQX09_09695 [Demequina sp. SYSU T00192]|uniref:Uncharacterized protein n=1 Tax=Demequina litoralis TaxID=3051660 RepID=A0ABT8GAX1_9MICO|nr:hypothetical protein [Demequina sp. SYSU T00192]MDN4476124.1 hypothetical protein [Demequina sp. SYSU T00192]
MGAGFVLTGLLLVLTLGAAALLRWQARPGHAIVLASAAVAMTALVAVGGVVDVRDIAAAEPEAMPTAALVLVADDPDAEIGATVDTAALPLDWLLVQGAETVAAIPWPVPEQAEAVREGAATPVSVTEGELADYYLDHGILARDGADFLVQTRAGWPARVSLLDGMLTVTFG